MNGKCFSIASAIIVLILLQPALAAGLKYERSCNTSQDCFPDYCTNESAGCFPNNCVHGVCRASGTYCGDSFCDANERCVCVDCENDTACSIASKAADSGKCAAGYDCASSICNKGTCALAATPCGNNVCEVNESCSCIDCSNASVCRPSVKKVYDSHLCTLTDECLAGSFCVHGTCRAANWSCGDGLCDLNETAYCRDCCEGKSCSTAAVGKNDSEACNLSSECGGGYCVHGTCASSHSLCGDGFCDEQERCSCNECYNQQKCLVLQHAYKELSFSYRLLAVASLIVSTVIGALFVVLTWKGRQLKGDEKQEYTLRTLFFPAMKGKRFSEKLALLIVNPFFWFLETAVFLFALFWTAGDFAELLGVHAYEVAWAGIILSLGFTFFVLLVSWLIDWYEREPLRFVFGMFMWGLLAASASLLLNTAVYKLQISLFGGVRYAQEAGLAVSLLSSAVIFAPIIEELFKGMGVLIVSAHHEFDDISDGILYGFIIGLGFAFFEGVLYFLITLNDLQSAMASKEILFTPLMITGVWLFGGVFLRVFVLSIGHGVFTATTGLFTGLFKQLNPNRPGMRYLGFGIGLFGAMAIHSINNFSGTVIAAISPIIPVLLNPFMIYSLALVLLIITIVAQLRKRKKDKQALEAANEEKKG